MAINIRKAIINDAQRIAEIHLNGWRYAYKGIVPDMVLDSLSLDNLTENHRTAIERGTLEVYVVVEDNIVYGHLTIGTCRDDDKKDNVFELWGIYIDPKHLREGYGLQLLKFCENQAIQRGFHEIVIWVLKDNKIGRNFYDKNGYKIDGTEKYLEHLSATEIRYAKLI